MCMDGLSWLRCAAELLLAVVWLAWRGVVSFGDHARCRPATFTNARSYVYPEWVSPLDHNPSSANIQAAYAEQEPQHVTPQPHVGVSWFGQLIYTYATRARNGACVHVSKQIERATTYRSLNGS